MSLDRIAANLRLSRMLALLGAGLALLCAPALQASACVSDSARAAMQAPQVSAKFSLAAKLCADKPEDGKDKVAAPGGDAQAVPAPTAPASPAVTTLDPRQHAQQLSMYDTRANTPSIQSAPQELPAVAPSAGGAPFVSRLKQRPQAAASAYAARPPGMSRESAARAVALVPEINRVAAAYGIDPLLLHAIAHVESRHNPDAVSHAGAMGLMQVMPATARRFGVTMPQTELRDPTISLEVSSAYLKTLQKRFDNNLTLIIAAYNAGEGAVEKYGRRVPPYKETQGYVRDVMAHYLMLVNLRDSANRPQASL